MSLLDHKCNSQCEFVDPKFRPRGDAIQIGLLPIDAEVVNRKVRDIKAREKKAKATKSVSAFDMLLLNLMDVVFT